MEAHGAGDIEAIICDIDNMLRATRRDLFKLQDISKLLEQQYKAEIISYLHYTVDKESIRRTTLKAKLILKILTDKRKRAMEIKRDITWTYCT